MACYKPRQTVSAHPKVRFALGAITAVFLVATTCVTAQTPELPQQIAQHEQALAAAKASRQPSIQATELEILGGLYLQAGQKQQALDSFNHSLTVQGTIGAPPASQANTLGNLCKLELDLDQPLLAAGFCNRALEIQRLQSATSAEAANLNNLGMAYDNLGQEQQAINTESKAMQMWQKINGGEAGQITTLNNFAVIYAAMGQPQKAIDVGNQALLLSRKIGGTAAVDSLNSFGTIYHSLGQPQNALDLYNQALPLERAAGDSAREATTLSSIGAVYDSLGQPQKALDFYSQALLLRQKVGEISGVASTLANIGVVYQNLGQGKTALGFYTQALPLLQKTGDRLGQATTLNNIGTLDDSLGDKAGALTNELVALSLAHAPGDSGSSNSGSASNGGLSKVPPPSFSAYGAPAIQAELAAPSQARAICDLDLEGAVYSSLMRHFSIQHQPILAIHFGLEAVNSYQQLRRDISSLNQQLQTGYAKSKSGTYRALAELLVGQGRLAEAEHVLDLVKDAELRETVRGSTGDPAAPLPLSRADNAVEANVAPASDSAVQLAAASYEFDALNALPSPTAAQTARLKVLSAQIAAGNASMENFFNTTLQSELGANSNANARVTLASDQTSSLANLLPDLGPGVLALYTLVGDQHSYIIVTTANTRTRYEINANAADLGKLTLNLRQLLENPGSGPGVDLEKLDHLLLDPIAADLAAAAKQSPDGIPTLLWSLDGVLRYIPMSALFDSKLPSGKQYLMERARNVVVTPESLTHLRDQPSANLKAVAFGTSKSYPAFSSLPALSGVAAELDSVVHDPTAPESHGPLNGRLMSNDDFTTTALEASLHQQPAIVHIASHFVFQVGEAGESYLLTGGDTTGGSGYGLPLSRIQSDPQLSLRNVSLITLSACETAVSDTTSNGREIDSLGMVMQKRDAAAVLATLWSVNDMTTSLLMSDFYGRWSTTAGIQKIEALRQTQLAMLHGALTNRPNKKSANSGNSNPDYPGFTHPFYWAPFVLIGNFR